MEAEFFSDRMRRRILHEQHVRMLVAIRARAQDRAMTLRGEHIGRVERYFA